MSIRFSRQTLSPESTAPHTAIGDRLNHPDEVLVTCRVPPRELVDVPQGSLQVEPSAPDDGLKPLEEFAKPLGAVAEPSRGCPRLRPVVGPGLKDGPLARFDGLDERLPPAREPSQRRLVGQGACAYAFRQPLDGWQEDHVDPGGPCDERHGLAEPLRKPTSQNAEISPDGGQPERRAR